MGNKSWMRRLMIAGLIASVGQAAAAPQPQGSQNRDGSEHRSPDVDPEAQLSPADLARMMAQRGAGGGRQGNDFPPFSQVSEGFEKVISTTDGRSFYDVYIRERDAKMIAELPRGYENKRQMIAMTVAGGDIFAGLQQGDIYCYWKRYDNQLALVIPNLSVRSSGDPESRGSVDRIFTDRVLLSAPIIAMGPNGQPVIDLNSLLLGRATTFFGWQAAGLNPSLAKIKTAKAFPNNIEIAFEAPVAGGTLRTFHYSISEIPRHTGYRPRRADPRVGYFTTSYRDLGKFDDQEVPVRYINRWHLEKRDPSLQMSPPKEPIVFYVDHATPVRYRRWVRRGVEYWNEAFRQIGLEDAIEVRFQDAQTGAHMEKDPEDVRYNFIRWLSNDVGTAIGPSRVHPETGQILDADVVLTDGFLRSWVLYHQDIIPDMAIEGFGPDALAWLERNPRWDPRLRLLPESKRAEEKQRRAEARARGVHRFAGHPAGNVDTTLIGDDKYDGLYGRVSQTGGYCAMASVRSVHVQMLRAHWDIAQSLLRETLEAEQPEIPDDVPPEVLEMIRRQLESNPELLAQTPDHIKKRLGLLEPEGEEGEEAAEARPSPRRPSERQQMLDGIPEEFVGPLLADLVAHEVGHTLGLRHNFKASSIFKMDEINSPEVAGQKPLSASVMDYNGLNIRMEAGEKQGDFGMIHIGPYDKWAIEYGYTFGNHEEVLKRVADHDVPYATDEDTWGPDPLAARWDMGADPIEYAHELVRLANWQRSRILTDFVKDGESWSRARRGYSLSLWSHMRAMTIMSRWIGGSYVLRDFKGDPGDREPITPVEVEKQREALGFIIKNAFYDDAFGLTPELLRHMTTDRWWDEMGFRAIFDDPAFPVHDRIMGVQSSVLTMLMNPQTLGRVFDNEMRIDPEEDALTLPEIISAVSDAIWEELGSDASGEFSPRRPMISSLRRNLQAEHAERLIDLMFVETGGSAGSAIRTLARAELERILEMMDAAVGPRSRVRPDAYSRAHLNELRKRVSESLEASFSYNAGGGGQTTILLFGKEDDTPESVRQIR